MAKIEAGATNNPNIYAVLSVLEPFKGSYTATLTGTTKATFTVTVGPNTVNYTVEGTGFTLTSGKLSAGTITGITTRVGTVGQFKITELNLTVADLNAAAAAEGSNLLALENLLSGGNHEFFGTTVGNNIYTPGLIPLTGTNTWTLQAGNDTLNGDDGVDNLYGGAGADVLNGGVGDDRLYGGTEDALVNTLNGDAGHDSLVGGNGADVLNGGSENDKLYGGLGADRLNGDAGTDRLDGGADADSLNGGTGRDSLIGGAGRDTLTGGADADVFVMMNRAHLGTDLASADQITDFQVGVDDILLKGLNLDWVGTRGFSSGTTVPEIRWDAASTSLQIDLDGNNSIDRVIDLQSGITLRESDLIL